MEQSNCNTESKKSKHLNYEKRIKLEALKKAHVKNSDIAAQLGCSERTIRRELALGRVKQLNSDLTYRYEYSADAAQAIHDERATNKGPQLKIGKDYELAQYLEEAIGKKRMSPYAAIEAIKHDKTLHFKTSICYKTVYNYLDNNFFLSISNKDLPVKKNRKKRNYRKIRSATNNSKGTSISERPENIDEREEYGHWEMDTVVGKQGTSTTLLVLTERKTREEIIYKISAKSQKCVVAELDKLERKLKSRFSEKFKTITCDNGCENLDFEGIENSVVYKEKKRTKVYYAHPYSAYERGSNENANKLIRRFIPKGEDISKYTKKHIKYIEHWINNYPRRIFNGLTSLQYRKQLQIA